jgi:hypothetical protein
MSRFDHEGRTPKPIDEQRARLQALQAEQSRVLESSGVAAKAWALRGDVSEEIKDATSLSVAITLGKDLDDKALERPSIKFTTTADPEHPGRTVSTYVTVAEKYEGVEFIFPAAGFNEEDARVVIDLLDAVKAGQAQGLLGEVTADLADIADPREQSTFL